jgi:hypothetical protein
MTPDERRDEDEQQVLRVTDRRRLTETGDVRDAEEEAAPVPSSSPEPASDRPATPEQATPSLPPPELPELGIGTVFLAFWQGAMLHLGMPDQSGARSPVDLDAARESIDLLRVLAEKTKGNLSAEEDQMLRTLVAEAQLAYVQVAGGRPGSAS